MAKRREMNRTSGTARRTMSQSELISYAIKTGKPLTGSASGVKSITLQQAGEALTQGIVTVRGGKLMFSPEAFFAMALPVGKVAKAAKALTKAGNIARGADAAYRVAVKKAGWDLAREKAMISKYGPGLVVNSPKGRLNTNAYPKSYAQPNTNAPVSELFGPKSPTAGTYRINGRRYVDNRYRFNMPKVKPNKNNY